ncbi:restriction endonuclease subunit S [Gelidibacter sp. F2691]|nr:restriction endonuclease subunit S [Gelidibacter sp. F2691]
MNKTIQTKAFQNTTIPSDWEVKSFEDIADIDKISLKSNTPEDYEFDYISLSDVDSNDAGSKIETTKQVFANAPSRARRVVNKGDILMSTVRPNLQGFTLIENEVVNLIASTGFAVITVKEVINNYLFQYLFSSATKRQFHQLIVGSNYPAINSSDVKELKIPLPPLPEQKAIAQVLSTWDNAIQKTEALLAQKELRKKWLMQQLLTGKKRLKGFDGEWREVKMTSIIKEYKQKPKTNIDYEVFTSSKLGLLRQTDYYGNNRITNRTDADYNIIPPGYLTYRSRSDDGLFTFNKNDLDIIGLISGYYPVFTTREANIDFMLTYLNYYKEKLTKYATGTSQLVLSINALKDASFLLPMEDEQTAIAQVLQTADKEIELIKVKAAQLREQKKGLMQQLLTGKRRMM